MRTRTPLLATCIAAALAVVSTGFVTPAQASGTVKGSWVTPNLLPEPSGGGHCKPLIAQARATKAYTIPGPGTFTMTLNNKLDWSADLRGPGDDILQEADGTAVETVEVIVHKFKKKTAIVMGACNMTGEPSVTVSWEFRPLKKR